MGAVSLRGLGCSSVPKIHIASRFHRSWEQNMRFISIMRKKSKVFGAPSLASVPSQLSAVSSTKEKWQERNLWVAPGSKAQLALTPPLSLRKVHGGHLYAANLCLTFSWQFSGQLTPFTMIAEVGFQIALSRAHSENLSKRVKASLIFAFS